MRIFLPMCAVLIASCAGKNTFEGHWVSTPYLKGGVYETLDFEGSRCYHNKTAITCQESGELKLKEVANGQYELFYEAWKNHGDGKFFPVLRGDTLELVPEDKNLPFGEMLPFMLQGPDNRWLFVRSKKDDEGDRFCCVDVQISLPETNLPSFDLSHFHIIDLSLGKPKSQFFSEQRKFADEGENETPVPFSPDSVVMQIDDVFVELDDLPPVVEGMRDLLGSEKDRLLLRLNIDRQVDSLRRSAIINKIQSIDSAIRIVETKYNTTLKSVIFTPVNFK